MTVERKDSGTFYVRRYKTAKRAKQPTVLGNAGRGSFPILRNRRNDSDSDKRK